MDIPPTGSEPDPVAAAHLQHELTIVHGLGDVKAPLKGRSNDFNLSFQWSKKDTITNGWYNSWYWLMAYQPLPFISLYILLLSIIATTFVHCPVLNEENTSVLLQILWVVACACIDQSAESWKLVVPLVNRDRTEPTNSAVLLTCLSLRRTTSGCGDVVKRWQAWWKRHVKSLR